MTERDAGLLDDGDLGDKGYPGDDGDRDAAGERGPRPPEEVLAELAAARIRELRQLGDEEGVIRVTAAVGRAIELLRGTGGERDPAQPEYPA